MTQKDLIVHIKEFNVHIIVKRVPEVAEHFGVFIRKARYYL